MQSIGARLITANGGVVAGTSVFSHRVAIDSATQQDYFYMVLTN